MRYYLILLTVLFFAASGCSQTQEPITADLDVAQFQNELAKGEAVLIDVRTPGEYERGHIAGSRNMDWTADDHMTSFVTLDPKTPVLLYCQAGGRSGKALKYLQENGYDVKHLAGGFSAWESSAAPVEK